MQALSNGAEAVIFKANYLGKPAVVKKRMPKKYRHPLLDEKIRAKRTKQECVLLTKAKQAKVRTPVIYKVERKSFQITMEFVDGQKVKAILGKKNSGKICKKIGEEIGKLHLGGIIHGDLSTGNIIQKKNSLVFVDFGLGFFSKKTEDQAADLLSLKKTFLATHFSLKKGFEAILAGYKNTFPKALQAIKQIDKIEARTRYS